MRVTKISEAPSSQFSNNNIIELDWSIFFDKAKKASDHGVANVAYPNSDPH